MDAWKEKRNWEDVLSTPHRVSFRFSHSPGLSRKSAERARTLHDKLMSPEKKKKKAIDLKKEAEEKHARAMRIRTELENERVQKLQRTSEKLNHVSEWQTVRSMKLREVMYARHQRSESRHEAYLAEVVRREGDESIKVNEVRFITSLNEENKKLILRQKLHDSQLRRAEKLQVLKTKQKEDMAREEAVLECKKLIEAEKLQRLAETQRKKEVRAKAQQEEAELLAQKLAERLRESEQRRKIYLEQIRERASMDFRDQSSPFRHSVTKDGQGRSTPISNCEDNNENNGFAPEGSILATTQHSLKRRIKKIRQRLMALKYDCPEPSISTENTGFVYRTAVANARVKIAKWLQELQRLRQARKEGAVSFGVITAEIIKIGLLLLESLSLLGYFSLFHPENQAVLRWGKSPTILHKVCDLPFVFFSDPELMPVLAGTMVAACFGCEQNKDVIQQELSTDMLLALLKACRSSLPSANSFTVPNSASLDEAGASTQLGPESKNLQVDVPLKSNRNSQRNARVLSQRSTPLPTTRTARIRSLRENKVVKPCEGKGLKSNSSVPESTGAWMLHSRLSTDLLDKAEQFFAAVTCNENGEL